MKALFQARRDTPFRLLTYTEIEGALALDHYLTAIPVKVRGSHVEICFCTRWDINVSRFRALKNVNPPQPRPGAPGYRRFRNLKLTISRDDPVRIRRYDPRRLGQEEHALASTDVVLKVLETGQGRAEFSVTGPSDQMLDLTQFDGPQGVQLREILDKLNHGDAWDRSDVL